MSDTTAADVVTTPSKTERYLPLIAMIFVTSMTFIDMTIVSIAAPDLEKDLGISDEAVQWVVNGYLLALAAFFALSGRIADVYGHKKMAIIGTVVFAFSSAMCGLTPEGTYAATWIISFRVIQGIGAAMLFPAALAIVVSAFPLRERGRALAVFFAITGAFTAIGPIAGGYLVEWSWRAIFWVNIPIAIIAVILTALCKPTLKPKKESIDWLGGAFIVLGMGLSVLGFQQASQWGWGSFPTIGCIIAGILIIGIFIWYELRQEHPLIKLRIFKDRAFIADNFVLFVSMMTFVPIFFFMSMYAQVVLGYSSQDAGLFLMWYFIGFVVTSQAGGALLDRYGSKASLIIGSAIGAIGYAGWAFQSTVMQAGAITPWIVVAGAGLGFIVGPASTDAVNRAIDASYGEVTGITQTLRNYGSALGMAILGTIMLNAADLRFMNSLLGFGLSEEQAQTFIDSSGNATSGGTVAGNVPAELQSRIYAAMQLDFAQAIQIVLYFMAGAMVVAMLIAFIHPGGRVVLPAAEEEAAEAAQADEDESPVKQIIKRVVIFLIIFGIIYALIYFL